ncbi:MAG: TAXI family TRAP transporter solute-binding subunit [Deltaproteobacteria bacterium]|jgi:TRAP transporter TAXI family solute receptor|nr:TAXI family TRAP transporter solute-binding subunit [Deltaproteobacteria bacterium]
MGNFLAMTAVAFLAAATLASPVRLHAQGAQLQQEFATMGTGSAAGVYYPVGGIICNLLGKTRRAGAHNIRCTVESTGASVFNVNAVRSGELSMGIVQSDVQNYAYNGIAQFLAVGADPELRVLFSLQSEAFSLMAREDAGIQSFEDLRGKRVNLGDPGSGSRNTLELLMKEYGWTPGVFSSSADFKPAEMPVALCDGRIDAFVHVVGHPNDIIQEAANTCTSRLVPVTGPEVDAFVARYPFYPPAVIKGGTYKGSTRDILTFGPRATLVTSSRLPENIAYHVTRSVFVNFDEFKSLHPALSDLTPQDMLGGNSAPFHPGAVRYFTEAGIQLPE